MRKFLVGAAIAFAALAVAGFVWALRRPWQPTTDFDIIGILWVMQNLPKMFVFVVSALLAGLSAHLFLKARTLVGIADGRSLEDEGRRIIEDARFHGLLEHRLPDSSGTHLPGEQDEPPETGNP